MSKLFDLTGRNEPFRDGAADAAARAGDKRDAAGEIKHGHGDSFGKAGETV